MQDNSKEVSDTISELYANGIDLRGYEAFFTVPVDAAARVGIDIEDGQFWLRGAGSWFLASGKIVSIDHVFEYDAVYGSGMNGEARAVSGLKQEKIRVAAYIPHAFECGEFEFMFAAYGQIVEGKCFVVSIANEFASDSVAKSDVEIVLIGKSETRSAA